MRSYTAVMMVPIQFEYPAIDDADAMRIAIQMAELGVTKVGHPPPVIHEIQKHKEPNGEATAQTA